MKIELNSKEKLYQPIELPGFEMIGVVTAGSGTGALVKNKNTGMYAMANAGVLSSLDQGKVRRSLSKIGNKNAAKDHKNDTQVTLRVSSAEKSAWVKASHPGKLSDWVRRQLNLAVLRDLENAGCRLYFTDEHFKGDYCAISAYMPDDAPDWASPLEADPADLMQDWSDQYGFEWQFNPKAVMPENCRAMYYGFIPDAGQ